MIRFRTLGVLELTASDGVELRSVLRQSKRLALLSYLVLGTPGAFQRRDRLVAMFWPELDRAGARHALSQAIHFLRRALGRDVLISRGDEEVGIAPGRLWCDAVAFREALSRGDLENALDLYGGELLPAFHASDAPDYERWLEEERASLVKEAAAAAWSLAEQNGAAGDGPGAAVFARRAVSLLPWDEAGVRRLIRLLDGMGDRAGAIEAYHDFERRLQVEFEVAPSAETKELIAAIKQRESSAEAVSDRPILEPRPARADSSDPVDVTTPAAAAVSGGVRAATRERLRSGGQTRRRRWILVAGGVLFIALGAWTAQLWEAPDPVEQRDRVAVLYFHDQTVGSEHDYLADALTTELIRLLHHEDKIEVISAQGVRQFRGRDAPLDTVARVLDVDYVVDGTVTQAGDQLQVYAELVDARDGGVIDWKLVQRPAMELFSLVADVSREVASFLRPALGREIRLSRWQAGTSSREAWQLMKQAEALRLRAMDAESGGDASAAWGALARADTLLARASKLDPTWLEPLVLQGWIAERRAWLCLVSNRAENVGEWLARALTIADQALRTAPGDPAALELRGTIRYHEWLLEPPAGPAADTLLAAAERDLRSALRSEPTLPRAESNLSAVLYSQGRFAESLEAARRAYEADAYLTDANTIVTRLFLTSFEVHDDAEAAFWCNEMKRRMPDRWTQAYCELVLLGWSEDAPVDPRLALHTYATFGREDPEPLRRKQDPLLRMLLAASLARAGQLDSARSVIDQAREAGAGDIEVMELEAAALTAMGRYEEASAVLERYLALRPTARARVAASRFFEKLPVLAASER